MKDNPVRKKKEIFKDEKGKDFLAGFFPDVTRIVVKTLDLEDVSTAKINVISVKSAS